MYPQPHEGIRGTIRDEPWLSKDAEMVPVRDAIAGLTHQLWLVTLAESAHGALTTTHAYATHSRINAHQPGDLVIEVSRALHSQDPKMRHWGFGYLLAERQEWCKSDEDWLAECAAEEWDPATEERTTERATYIQYGPRPEDICRWHNAMFDSVPLDLLPEHVSGR